MAFIEWTDKLSVGFRLIDEDHKRLITHVNTLFEAAAANAEREKIIAILEETIAFTRTHFIHEETLMRKTAFPQFIPHKIEHDRLITQIEDLKKRYEAGQVGLSQDTIVYLRTWVCDHILQVDGHLGKFLAKHSSPENTESGRK